MLYAFHEAAYYDSVIKGGRTIVTVRASNRYDEAWNIMTRYGAYYRQTPARTYAQPVAQEPVTNRNV